MLFTEEHVEMIKNGTKTQTRRLWKNRRAVPGRIHKVKTQMLSKDHHCEILIKDVKLERLGDITQEDALKEGGYSLEEYKQVWVECSKKRQEWDPDLIVYVVDFELVKGE